jgi:hypothetical protein
MGTVPAALHKVRSGLIYEKPFLTVEVGVRSAACGWSVICENPSIDAAGNISCFMRR